MLGVRSVVVRSVGAGPPPHLRNVVSPAPTTRTFSIHTFSNVVSPAPTTRTFSIHAFSNVVSPAPHNPHLFDSYI
jgi:hypothetical protein